MIKHFVLKHSQTICLVFLILLTFVLFKVGRSCDDSMRPGIGEGDLVVATSYFHSKTPKTIVLTNTGEGNHIRRIVAIEGDTVDIKDSSLVVNGYPQYEEYAEGRTFAFANGISLPITLKKGEYFVMADNREYSEDSRLYGPISSKNIKGVVLLILRHRRL